MASEDADRRYLLAREMDMWLAEGERTERHLSDLDFKDTENPEVRKERAWLDHIHRRRNELAWEVDNIENAQKSSGATVVKLDDLDRHEEQDS
jgi:hypothetical protein